MEYNNDYFNRSLSDWLNRVQTIINKERNAKVSICPSGRKYTKIVDNNGVFCFIDNSNGDVLMAASWRSPAKHARGNIYHIGQEGVNAYGANYLK
jgi:hypothetical protein